MINVQACRVLSEVRVIAYATLTHDQVGNAIKPRRLYLGAVTFDGTSALSVDDVALGLGRGLALADQAVGVELGGWHSLL